jgi:hypothetical protein
MSDGVDRILDVAGAAAFLKIAPQTIRNYSCQGRIPVLKIGRRSVFDRDALLAWLLAQNEAEKQPEAKKRKGRAA